MVKINKKILISLVLGILIFTGLMATTFYEVFSASSSGSFNQTKATANGIRLEGSYYEVNYTPGATNVAGAINYDDGLSTLYMYPNNNYCHKIEVFPYKTINAVTTFSTNFTESAQYCDDGNNDGHTYYITWSWDAVAGADGYRILKYDTFNGYNYDNYYDTASNSFNDGDWGASWSSGNTVTPFNYSAENQSNYYLSGDYISKIFGSTTKAYWNVSLGMNNISTNVNVTLQTRTADDLVGTDPNLYVHYTLDNTPNDTFGNLNGTWVSGASYDSSGKINQAGKFLGSNYISINDANSIDPQGVGNFSVSAWVLFNDLSCNGGCTDATGCGCGNAFLSKAVYSGGWNGYHFETGGNSVGFFLGGAGIASNGVSNPLQTGVWEHIVGVWENDGSISIYLNGIKYNGGSATSSIANTNKLYIGRNFDNSYPRYLNGEVDDVRIYNRSLNELEVMSLYNLGTGRTGNWSAWSSSSLLTSGVPKNYPSAKFIQFKTNLYTNDTTVSPYLINDTVESLKVSFNNVSTEKSFAISQFVKVNGTSFTLAGNNYTLMGADSYYLADYATNHTYDDAGNEINNSQAYVQEILDKARYLNVNVIRTWACMAGGNQTSNNGSDWVINKSGGHYNLFLNNNYTNYNETMFKALDYVIYEAGKRDIRLQLVLVNNWDTYGGARWWVQQASGSMAGDGTEAYHDQFYNNSAVMLAFQTYINYTLNRNNTYSGIQYKNDPAIFAWLLVNEPRTKSTGTNHSIIAAWTKNMTSYIKSIDSNHLVGLGVEGFGYVETWGEGTDMIAAHNGTGVDFATFELHPTQWDYFAQRSENGTNGAWVNGTISSIIPSAIVNATLDWWSTGSGYSYNNRYAGSFIPAYIPALARHGYQNWVSQNVNWSINVLKMPILLQEVALPTNTSILTDSQKARFFNNVIYNFFSGGGSGIMMWNLNHDAYASKVPSMDDGYSFYYSSDPTLKAKSQGVISAYNFTLHNNTGGTSWVTSLDDFKYIFYYNVSTDGLIVNNCSLWLNITNSSSQSTNYYLDQVNASEVLQGVKNTFTKQFASTDKSFYWYTECCDNNSLCFDSTPQYVLMTMAPSITLTSPANDYYSNNSYFTFNYTVHDNLGVSSCDLYIDGVLNQTNSSITTDVNQNFYLNFSTATKNYNWNIRCTDTGSNVGLSEVRDLIFDKAAPNAVLTSPLNNTFGNSSSVNFIINLSDDASIKNATLHIFNSTGEVETDILQLVLGTAQYTWNVISSLADNVYTWFVTIFDFTNTGFTMKNNTLTIDTTFPQINFTNPTPSNGSFKNANAIYINVSSTDTNTVSTFIDLDSSLVGWWKLDQENGTFFSDYFGKSNGTCASCPIYVTAGARGGAYDFNSSASNYVDLGSNANTNLTNTGTISLWINKPAAYPNGVILSRGNVYSDRSGYGMYVFNGAFYFEIANNSAGISTTSTLTTGVWTHFVGTWNGTTVSLYKNGVLIQNISQTVNSTPSTNLVIGANNGGANIFYNGSVDDIILFNRSLSASEVLSLYNSTKYSNNLTNLADGVHTYRAYVEDAAGNVNSTEKRTMTTDATAPTATLNTPANNTYANTNQNLTVNLTDATSGLQNATLNIYNSTGLYNQTSMNLNSATSATIGFVVSLTDGIYKWFYQVFDVAGNSFISQNNTLTKDATNPTVTIVSLISNSSHPSWGEYYQDQISFNWTASDTNLDYAYFNVTNSSGALIIANNVTRNVTFGPSQFPRADDYIFVAWANDSAGNSAKTATLIGTFTIADTTAPSLNITVPIEGNLYKTTTVNLTFLAYDISNLSSAWWNTNGTNTTLSIVNNLTSSQEIEVTSTAGASESHTLMLCVNDTFDNTKCDTRTITIDLTVPAAAGGGASGWVTVQSNTTSTNPVTNLVNNPPQPIEYLFSLWDTTALWLGKGNHSLGVFFLSLILLAAFLAQPTYTYIKQNYKMRRF